MDPKEEILIIKVNKFDVYLQAVYSLGSCIMTFFLLLLDRKLIKTVEKTRGHMGIIN